MWIDTLCVALNIKPFESTFAVVKTLSSRGRGNQLSPIGALLTILFLEVGEYATKGNTSAIERIAFGLQGVGGYFLVSVKRFHQILWKSEQPTKVVSRNHCLITLCPLLNQPDAY
jgi:hypothetical protein